MVEVNYEEVPGTWAHRYKEAWVLFNCLVRIMDDSGGKVPHEKWRDYLLYDMKIRHDEESHSTNKGTQSVEES